LAKAKADFAGAMGSLIVAEAVAKEEVEKRKQVEDQLVKCQQIKEDNLGIAERWQNRADALKVELEQVKSWLREVREGWSGSDGEFTEYYGDLAEMLDVEFTEDVDVELTLSVNIRVRRPIGVTLDDANDFWFSGSVDVDSNYEVIECSDIVVEDASE
jgi:hypothetical protein